MINILIVVTILFALALCYFLYRWLVKLGMNKKIQRQFIMSIKCNNYCPELEPQLGDQPVRVFYRFYGNIFLNISSELEKDYPHADLNQLLLRYQSNKTKPQSPFATSWAIQIEESFLSFLWCYCYGLVVRLPAKDKKIAQQEIVEAGELLKYAKEFLKNYKGWDKNTLPNPELHGRDEKRFIGVSNGMFLVAVNYVFYHEFAHIVLGHTKEGQVDLERKLEIEREADKFAFERIIKGSQFDEMSYIGVLAALGAFTFTSQNFQGRDHPDLDHRIANFLECLDFPEDHHCWIVALWAILEWQIHFQKLEFPEDFKNGKEYFYEMLEKIQKLKNN
jgi:hypothetical protein